MNRKSLCKEQARYVRFYKELASSFSGDELAVAFWRKCMYVCMYILCVFLRGYLSLMREGVVRVLGEKGGYYCGRILCWGGRYCCIPPCFRLS